jgi:hypothetical protein
MAEQKESKSLSPTINSFAEPLADPATFKRGLSPGWSRETANGSQQYHG